MTSLSPWSSLWASQRIACRQNRMWADWPSGPRAGPRPGLAAEGDRPPDSVHADHERLARRPLGLRQHRRVGLRLAEPVGARQRRQGIPDPPRVLGRRAEPEDEVLEAHRVRLELEPVLRLDLAIAGADGDGEDSRDGRVAPPPFAEARPAAEHDQARAPGDVRRQELLLPGREVVGRQVAEDEDVIIARG